MEVGCFSAALNPDARTAKLNTNVPLRRVMAKNCKVLDCRWFPADIPCEFAISGNEEEVLNIAVQHSVDSHGYRDTPALREQLRALLRDDRRKRVVHARREERRKEAA